MKLCRRVHLIFFPVSATNAKSSSTLELGSWNTPVELDVTVSGDPNATTGYILGINDIDLAVRCVCQEPLQAALWAQTSVLSILEPLRQAIQARIARPVERLSIRQQHTSTLAVEALMPDHAILTQRFDFAASHRLHCSTLDHATNKRIFGKCNNPAGHGHNYRLEVEVAVPLQKVPSDCSAALDKLVRDYAVDRLDHKHLNTDLPCFEHQNPSVEAIAKVCFDWLQKPIAGLGASLRRVRLWETEKTSAIYPD